MEYIVYRRFKADGIDRMTAVGGGPMKKLRKRDK